MTMDEKMINLETFANGALAVRINDGLKQVIENIADPNTVLKFKRKLTVTIDLSPDAERELAEVNILVKPTLAPAEPTNTKIIIGRDKEGKVVGAEYRKGVPGQVYMATDEVIEPLEAEPELPAGLRIV